MSTLGNNSKPEVPDGSLTPSKLNTPFVLPSDTTMAATPPQFDNDLSVATTEFVQRALGNFQRVLIAPPTGALTLTAADVGSFVTGGDGRHVVLPAASSVPAGSSFYLNVSYISTTSGTIYTARGSNVSTPYEVGFRGLSSYAHVVCKSGVWQIIGGAAALKDENIVLAESGGSGLHTWWYHRLPNSNIIMQGGSTTIMPGFNYVTLPVSHTNGGWTCYVQVMDGLERGSRYTIGASFNGLTQLVIAFGTDTGGVSGVWWFSVGK